MGLALHIDSSSRTELLKADYRLKRGSWQEIGAYGSTIEFMGEVTEVTHSLPNKSGIDTVLLLIGQGIEPSC